MKNVLHYIGIGLAYAMLPFVAIIALVLCLLDIIVDCTWKLLCWVAPGVVLCITIICVLNHTCRSFQESTGRAFIYAFGVPGIPENQDLDINNANANEHH